MVIDIMPSCGSVERLPRTRITMLASRTTLFLRGAVLMVLLALAACQSSMPVQEMSDARQAISAAKEAGAEKYAAADLGAAIHLLQSAEENLKSHDYSIARQDAVEAKTRAIDALRRSEASRDAEN